MTNQEFSDQFEVLYNNITSNLAPGLDEYEKSVFLTKSQRQILLEYLSPLLNKVLEGYDGSPKRLVDFSGLTVVENLDRLESGDLSTLSAPVLLKYINQNLSDFRISPGFEGDGSNRPIAPVLINLGESVALLVHNTYNLGTKVPATFRVLLAGTAPIIKVESDYITTTFSCSPKEWMKENNVVTVGKTIESHVALNRFVGNSILNIVPVQSDVVDLIDDRSVAYQGPKNEILYVLNERLICNDNGKSTRLTVVPISYVEYSLLMSKPYKWPIKQLAWRLILKSGINDVYEVIAPLAKYATSYTIRYVKSPMPIILGDLSISGLSIEGKNGTEPFYSNGVCCEAPEILHEPILQRAVELAKAAYVGDLNSQIALGTNSQTEIGMISKGNREQ